MTEEQIVLAEKHVAAYTREVLKLEHPNLRFVRGEIEDLQGVGIADASIDLIISNCVVCFGRFGYFKARGVYMLTSPSL